ncbi:uncharacterized protein CC84DRAFT_58094 [Paraphaeosphaeria sporulosa]|uniref:Uncharacterized protein n=1 Tax=Paraphaeosphaeria sporulosa TaxID=1460663 RepID=A0A177CYH7_9PLEO|nr:uncharacterized protein CC84DRAFT_58094 [Paraphaeosphaeria sporulosa]OAG11870.1 hypothetical protein CC84DRAFT_58094 [Paraphaeosphaeria sporulosa]
MDLIDARKALFTVSIDKNCCIPPKSMSVYLQEGMSSSLYISHQCKLSPARILREKQAPQQRRVGAQAAVSSNGAHLHICNQPTLSTTVITLQACKSPPIGRRAVAVPDAFARLACCGRGELGARASGSWLRARQRSTRCGRQFERVTHV